MAKKEINTTETEVVVDTTSGDELVETIKETEATDEEVVQSVAEAIVEEAKEENKTVEEVVEEIVEEVKEDNKKSGKKDLDELVKLRGFKSYKDAEKYLKSEAFNKLDNLNQAELEDWFENLK